jgi:glycosyltransferase involved in cell wall biosynthesis
VDSFIAMSEFSRDKHKELGFPRDMDVVNYFLPDSAKSETAGTNESPQERPYFLFVGRLEKIKGLDDVIPIFAKYPEADLIIAGDGTHSAELKQIGANIPNVKFLGRLAPEALDRYYKHAQALIVPSAGFETFGIILIESFRQGTPVIARRIGPFPEIVKRSGGGELFGSPDELLEAMRSIQTNPSYRQRMAAAARDSFSKYWSESAVMPQYLDVVRKTAASKGRKDILNKLEMAGAS